FLADTRCRILEVNHQAEELLGRPAAEIVGRTWDDFTHPDEVEAQREHVQKLLTEGHIRRTNVRIPRADGQPAFADYSASLVELEGEQVILAIVHDVTERNRL